MVDTERFHLGPHTVQVVGAIATAIGRDRSTSLLEIATFVPLDVESIGRIVDSLAAEEILALHESDDSLKTFAVVDPSAYQEAAAAVDGGDHLDDGFVQNLVALRADPDWCRKVRDQHLVLRAAASANEVIDVDRIVALVDIPPARVRAAIGDFEAEGCVLTDADEDSMSVTFPASLQYPPERFDQNDGCSATWRLGPHRFIASGGLCSASPPRFCSCSLRRASRWREFADIVNQSEYASLGLR